MLCYILSFDLFNDNEVPISVPSSVLTGLDGKCHLSRASALLQTVSTTDANEHEAAQAFLIDSRE
jgi:hypothetical protein